MIAGAVLFFVEGALTNIPYSFHGLSGAEHKFAWRPGKARHELGPFDPEECNNFWFRELLQTPIQPLQAQVLLIEHVPPPAPEREPERAADPAPVARPKAPQKRRPGR